ncbi:hypothetical protein F8B43_0993 [Methylorubrum populi]|uniref:Uncharacterized protein n=1 Tax=Methylorubrum populi TaxID=223967 RepID=A0A833JAT8_9HYPH|nr:hypothetical protein F8B43_0993 [Methylorubrum populi]
MNAANKAALMPHDILAPRRDDPACAGKVFGPRCELFKMRLVFRTSHAA